jgi:ADP-ribosyl-[dinitrogen reductase] hydrolase
MSENAQIRRLSVKSMEDKELKDRVAGVLAGLAAGDRNGGPIQMAVRLAESLAEMRAFDRADIACRYLSWWRDGAFDTGPVTAGVLQLAEQGIDFDEAAARVDLEMAGQTAGCNPAHRCAPLGIAPFLSDGEVGKAALLEASLTHQHPLAGDTAATVALLCRLLIRGADLGQALQRAGEGRLEEVRLALLGELSPGRGGYSPVVLGTAINFLRTSSTLADALARSIAFAGPANYCPVLVGSIGGARWGMSAVPETLLPSGTLKKRIEAAAACLARLW